MAVRYVEIGQYPDVRREVRGKLSEILVATANPGTYAAPEDVTGTFLEMGTDGKWDGASVGSFGSFEELNALPTAYLAFGARTSVNGVQYTYGAGGWAAVGGGGSSILPCYETIEARDAAYPATLLGQKIGMRRLCGNGYFEQMYNGVRWESFGSIIRDAGLNSVGYPLVASSTAYVVLASYVIPPGLVGDGEEWEISSRWKNNGIKTADAYPELRIGAFPVGGSVPSINGANFSVRTRAAIVRLGSVLECRQAGTNTDLYTGGAIQDKATNMSIAQTAYAGINPGTLGDTYTLRHWALTRIA